MEERKPSRFIGNKRAQPATEYLIVYGSALSVLIVVVVLLFESGIFSVSPAVSYKVSGFPNFGVIQACTPGGALLLFITNNVGQIVNVTSVSANSGTTYSSASTMITLFPGQTSAYYVQNACPSSVGASYKLSVNLSYKEPYSSVKGTLASSGIIQGSVTKFNPNYAASFLGYQTYIETPLVPNNATRELTISMWIYDSTAQSSYDASIGGTICPDGMVLEVNPSNEVYIEYTLAPFDAGNNCAANSIGSSAISFNAWHQIAVTFNGTGATLYVDGQKAASNKPASSQNSLWYNAGGQVDLGCYVEPTNRCFNGLIADVQFYNNTVLSASQILTLYNEGSSGAPISSAGLVGWWPLNDNALDYSGNNNNGLVYNVTFVTP